MCNRLWPVVKRVVDAWYEAGDDYVTTCRVYTKLPDDPQNRLTAISERRNLHWEATCDTFLPLIIDALGRLCTWKSFSLLKQDTQDHEETGKHYAEERLQDLAFLRVFPLSRRRRGIRDSVPEGNNGQPSHIPSASYGQADASQEYRTEIVSTPAVMIAGSDKIAPILAKRLEIINATGPRQPAGGGKRSAFEIIAEHERPDGDIRSFLIYNPFSALRQLIRDFHGLAGHKSKDKRYVYSCAPESERLDQATHGHGYRRSSGHQEGLPTADYRDAVSGQLDGFVMAGREVAQNWYDSASRLDRAFISKEVSHDFHRCVKTTIAELEKEGMVISRKKADAVNRRIRQMLEENLDGLSFRKKRAWFAGFRSVWANIDCVAKK
jgi:hypothetical protein